MIRNIVNNLRCEEGWVVVTAVVVMSIMMGIGLATYATVDTQQGQSRVERERDSSFNLGESAFYAEAFILGQDWPTAANPYPLQCTETSPDPTPGCPTPTDLRSALDSQGLPDLASDARWTIRVRDNSSPTTSDYDFTTNAQPRYDANGDGKLWVRADGVAKGRSRSIVGLLQLEDLGESVVQNVITAGHFYTSNKGNKVVVDTQGNSATGSQVLVRCIPGPGEPQARSGCIGYDSDKTPPQVSPERVYSAPSTPNSMTAAQIARFRADAIAEGTYHTACPDRDDLTGRVVFVETSSYNPPCKYNGGGDINTEDSPGLLIFTNGVLEITGDATYYGFVYMLNPGNSDMTRAIVHGNGLVVGGVSVDGRGGVETGSSKMNVIFDGDAFSVLKTHGTAGLVQNSWRELTPGT